MSSYAEALLDFYGGEVAGEAVYSVLVGAARNDAERLARRELTDVNAKDSLEPLQKLLKYPVHLRVKETR